MNKSTYYKMITAQERLRVSSPAAYPKVRELYERYKKLYTLNEDDFNETVAIALHLNIRDGSCKKIK